LTNAVNTAQPDENFRFDANGNRVGAQSSGRYLVGRNNQILSDGTNRYAYDFEGNMAWRSNTVTGVLTTYQCRSPQPAGERDWTTTPAAW
jgi:hypothetical protein